MPLKMYLIIKFLTSPGAPRCARVPRQCDAFNPKAFNTWVVQIFRFNLDHFRTVSPVRIPGFYKAHYMRPLTCGCLWRSTYPNSEPWAHPEPPPRAAKALLAPLPSTPDNTSWRPPWILTRFFDIWSFSMLCGSMMDVTNVWHWNGAIGPVKFSFFLNSSPWNNFPFPHP